MSIVDPVCTAVGCQRKTWEHRLEMTNDGWAVCEAENIKLQVKIAELEDTVKRYAKGYKGSCYACEPVGELNLRLETAIREAYEIVAGSEGGFTLTTHAEAYLLRLMGQIEATLGQALTDNGDENDSI